jgi:hypothetical protein
MREAWRHLSAGLAASALSISSEEKGVPRDRCLRRICHDGAQSPLVMTERFRELLKCRRWSGLTHDAVT